MEKTKPYVDPNLNGYGLPFHPTDEYVHWSVRNPIYKMRELRAAYDAIVKLDPKLSTSLETLLNAAYENGRDDEADNNNPDL